jgi:hypothetical protein
MRYVVIEYKGSHSVSHTDRNLIAYEFSDDLVYLRNKYSLEVITNNLSWQIQKHGFSLYHKSFDKGILLIDKEVIKESSPYTLNIYTLMISVMRDFQIKNIIKRDS